MITIIILLILATVSISLVINNNVLDHAQHGVDKYSEEEELEQIKLAVASAMLKGNGFLETENLDAELQDRFQKGAEQIGNSKRWSLKLDKNYTIYENGNVEENESLLPAEYKQVEYIESSGTQYIDTGFIANQDTRVVFEGTMQYAEWTAYHLFGGRKSYTENIFLFGTYDNNYETKFNNQNTAFKTDAIAVRATVDKNKNVTTIYVNDKSEYSTTQTYEEFNSGVSLYLFATHTEIGNNPIGIDGKKRCFSCKIWDDKKLVRNFIPCYSITTVTDANETQKPANTKGLYDLVEGKFYTNQNTSGDDFNAGPNV